MTAGGGLLPRPFSLEQPMNKDEMIKTFRKRLEWSREQDARRAIDAVFDIIAGELAAGGSVTLKGFGRFETHVAAAREGRNPKTGEPMQIPAHRRVVFRAGKGLRARMTED
jgi:DNA-binding protein HU-beta